MVPTASLERWPATASLPRARETTGHLNAEIVPLVSSGEGFSFARSVNRGVAQSRHADAWVLLNDDCFMEPGWLDAMLDAWGAHPEAGLVGAVLRYPNGLYQHVGGSIAFSPLRGLRFLLYHSLLDAAPFWALRRVVRGPYYIHHHHRLAPRLKIDLVTAACMLIPRACWEVVGPFNEVYPMSMEDTEFNLRALEEGFEVVLATEARGVHVERASSHVMRPEIEESYRIFRQRWPRARIRSVLDGHRGILHPLGCGCPPGGGEARSP